MRAPADPRLRPRGHRHRHKSVQKLFLRAKDQNSVNYFFTLLASIPSQPVRVFLHFRHKRTLGQAIKGEITLPEDSELSAYFL
jgi:hypothetical protein